MERMKAALLVAGGKLEVGAIPVPQPEEHEVLVRTRAVGICGTDVHLFGGQANYNFDSAGVPIPLSVQPQVLGHEICGTVAEVGRAVADLKPGDPVVIDQALNCRSQRITPFCDSCASGSSHQCFHYQEHGLTGKQGGFAEYMAIAAVNAVRVEGDLPAREMALTEPLACILHAVDLAERSGGPYRFGGDRRVENILILGCGPAGILFLQYFRKVRRFDGPIFVVDVNPRKLALAESLGAIPLTGGGDDLAAEVRERTGGRKIDYLVEATGAGAPFRYIPALLRRQATVVLYGVGREGVDLSVLNGLHFVEPTVILPVGASGGFDADGRPRIYRQAMQHLTSGRVRVAPLITHTCRLDTLPQIFTREYHRPEFTKAVLLAE
jgi:threonine dehydrogenase-like Zn-dependent dehydrogenase